MEDYKKEASDDTAWLPGGSTTAQNDADACRRLGTGALLDWLLDYLGLRNDACLARELGVPPFTVSKLRSGDAQVDADMLIRMHEVSGLAIRELRAGMGDQRRRFHR